MKERKSVRMKKTVLFVFKNKYFSAGLFMFMAIAVLSILGGYLLPPKYYRAGSFQPQLPPSLEHPLGTDTLGRDVLAQLFWGIQNSMKIGLIVATIGTLVGAIMGFISGYYGGFIDDILRIIIDVFLSVPTLLFLILIASLVRGVTVELMALIISLFSWPWPARQVRAQVLSLKERDFVLMARLSGMGKVEIIVRELMPHMFQWMGANFINAFLVAVLTESGLSILGLGPQREMTLGMMIYWALTYASIYRGLWWWWSSPVITLIYLFFSLYILHIGFDELINPRLRER